LHYAFLAIVLRQLILAGMLVKEINVVKYAPFVRPFKGGVVYRLQSIVSIKCAKLVRLNETPCQRADDVNLVFIYCPQHLGQK
jgi:hypothetical protein